VAQKLHDTYGYSYDNLKVLLGGWNSWKNAGYATEGTGAAAPADDGSGKVITSTVPLTGNTPIIINAPVNVP